MLLFLFVSIFFIFSCQSDPVIGLNNLDNITLESKTFLLDQSISRTIQGDAGTSESAVLYSGIIETGDTVVALINLQSEKISFVKLSYKSCSHLYHFLHNNKFLHQHLHHLFFHKQVVDEILNIKL